MSKDLKWQKATDDDPCDKSKADVEAPFIGAFDWTLVLVCHARVRCNCLTGSCLWYDFSWPGVKDSQSGPERTFQ